MSDADEHERIRERKKRELTERLDGEESDSSPTPSASPAEPIPVEGNAHLDELVAGNDIVLVDFYADWCGPCKTLEPIVEQIAADTPAAVAKVDVDVHQQLASAHGVRGIPKLVLYADGEPAEQLVGMQQEAQLRELVSRYA